MAVGQRCLGRNFARYVKGSSVIFDPFSTSESTGGAIRGPFGHSGHSGLFRRKKVLPSGAYCSLEKHGQSGGKRGARKRCTDESQPPFAVITVPLAPVCTAKRGKGKRGKGDMHVYSQNKGKRGHPGLRSQFDVQNGQAAAALGLSEA
jgi:hypothetical protein